MLNELHIQNLGVIGEATAEFAGGLSVVTGETGAGKTMVISSLRLLSGHRADASRVRSGMDKAVVEGIFTSSSPAVEAMVDEIGGFMDDGEVIASRTVTAAGRSRAHLAGKTVAAGVLGEFSGHVITIHGQNDQLRLLDPVRQLAALDEFAGTAAEVARYRELRSQWRGLEKDLRSRLEARRELALESETLARAIETIDAIDPQPGEDEQLKGQIQRLQDADDLRAAMQRALGAIDGSEEDMEARGAAELVAEAADQLRGDDKQLSALAERLDEVSVLLGDISSEVGQALIDVPDPDSLEELLQRQQELRELRKYAVDVDGAIAWRDQARERLANIDVSGEAIETLQAQVAEAWGVMIRQAKKLSALRADAAGAFAGAVTEEIRGLQMSAAIRVDMSTQELPEEYPGAAGGGVAQPGKQGIDEVEFQLVQGGNANPLASSASGGELSRVMLALEVVLTAVGARGGQGGRTMVFDEVDAGVGGKAAVEIGRRLAKLAVDNQVIVVTHLPQVAAFADAHVYVAKSATENSVTSSVVTLDEEARVEELSRMLAGLESETGRAHAEELVEMARAAKQEISGGD